MELNTRSKVDGKWTYMRNVWDNRPMLCTTKFDKNDTLVYELDVLHHKATLSYLVIRYGDFKYKGHELYGWYIEIYSEGKKLKEKTPLYVDIIQSSRLITNLVDEPDFLEEVI